MPFQNPTKGTFPYYIGLAILFFLAYLLIQSLINIGLFKTFLILVGFALLCLIFYLIEKFIIWLDSFDPK